MVKSVKQNFTRGEIDPKFYGQSNLQGFVDGLALARNVFVHESGGVSNRPGQRFIKAARYPDRKCRLIAFEFGTSDTHVIEFGHEYFRVLRNDGAIVKNPQTIASINLIDPIEITTSGSHGYVTGSEVFISGIVGPSVLNNRFYTITVTGATTFTLDGINGSALDAYVSGGDLDEVLTVATPYQEEDLFNVKYKQSFDVIELTHPSYPTQLIRRLALDNWEIVEKEFDPVHPPPAGLAVSVGTTGSVTERYVVTAISEDTGEESLPALGPVSYNITAITQDNPARVTFSAATILRTGDEIEISGVVGMTELNGKRFRVLKISTTVFDLQSTDSTFFNAYVSGGTGTPTFVEITNGADPANNTISWTPVEGTIRYSIYKDRSGVYGFLGETSDSEYLDAGDFTANLQDTAPFFRNPFFGEGNYPAAAGDHEQRAVYGGSFNNPDRASFTQTGTLTNFTQASPLRPDDSFTITLPSRKATEIRHFLSFEDLLIFANSAVYKVDSREQAFTFANIKNTLQFEIGASQRRPLTVGQLVVFEEEKSERILGVNFDLVQNRYLPQNLSLYSAHLLRNETLADWDFLPWPDPLVLSPTESGKLLCLTLNPEEQSQVVGWTTWDTDGAYESVAVVRQNINAKQKSAYFSVKRVIDGQTVRYIEKLENRNVDKVEDAFFVDAGVTYDVPIDIQKVNTTNPVVIEAADHGLVENDRVDITDIVWEKEFDTFFRQTSADPLNTKRYLVTNPTPNSFQIKLLGGDGTLIDGSSFPAYISGGTVRKAVKTITGLRHLKNTEVVCLADGSVQRNLVVDSEGVLTLPSFATQVQIGLTYISDIQTLPLAFLSSVSLQASGEKLKVNNAVLRFEKSRGFLLGYDLKSLDEARQREFEPYDVPTALLTGDYRKNVPPNWSRESQIYIRQKDPLPLTLLRMVLDVTI